MRIRLILSYLFTALHMTGILVFFQLWHNVTEDNQDLYNVVFRDMPFIVLGGVLLLALLSTEKEVQQFIYTEVVFLICLGLVYVLNDTELKFDKVYYYTSNEFLITLMASIGILFNTFSFIQSWKILK